LVSFSSCRFFDNEKTESDAVARAYDNFLYLSDLKNLVPPNTSKGDSAQLIKNYIDNWIRQQLILSKAKLNLNLSDNVEIEKQIEEYRSTVITYSYKKELIKQQLDTAISMEEIQTYFDKNSINFNVSAPIVKANYVKLDRSTPDLDKFKKLYYSDQMEDRVELEAFCHQYANSFLLDSTAWIYFDDLMREVPLQVSDPVSFLKLNSQIEIVDSLNLIFIKIKEYRLKDETSPLHFELKNIKSIILNQRKLELIRKMEQSVYDDAIANNNFEIF